MPPLLFIHIHTIMYSTLNARTNTHKRTHTPRALIQSVFFWCYVLFGGFALYTYCSPLCLATQKICTQSQCFDEQICIILRKKKTSGEESNSTLHVLLFNMNRRANAIWVFVELACTSFSNDFRKHFAFLMNLLHHEIGCTARTNFIRKTRKTKK